MAKVLLRGGCVLTLGPRTSNRTQADVLIEGERVAEIGQALRARDAEVVDASDAIVMPGFVDTHRHTWTSLFRNLGHAVRDGDEPAHAGLDEHYEPDDVYAATLIGLLGALESGTTTVVDWPLDREGGEHSEAALQAHEDSGLRTVFVRTAGSAGGATPPQRPKMRIASGVDLTAEQHLDRLAAARSELDGSGSRIHVHVASPDAPSGLIPRAASRGSLDEAVTLVHCQGAGPEDIEVIASSGAAVSIAPSSEMAGGAGSPPIQELIDRGIRPGLGVGTEGVAPGDMFAQMRATISLQHATVFDRKLAGKAGVPKLMTTRDVIRYATVDGARVAGWGGVTGSIEPGMQADLIVLRTDRPNVFPVNDPIGAVVWGMDTSNLDAVFVGGTWLVRDGTIQADVARARSLAHEARERVARSAGLLAGAKQGDGTP
jgi:cytosine/adenosine deaminase-related metal-dependent hydrolase